MPFTHPSQPEGGFNISLSHYLQGTTRYPLPCAAPPNLQTVAKSGDLSSAGVSSSGPDPVFPNVGQEHERGQRPGFTLTRHPGSSEVELRTGDEVPLSLPLVSRGDFTLYGWSTYDLRTLPPSISFLLSSDPPSSDEGLGATAHGSLSFDHGRAEETITVTYQWIGTEDEEVTMTWLHLFALLPGYHPVVKLLLHHGADPKGVTSFLHQTPLHLAGTPETATLLIENGAEFNVRDENCRTPLHLASRLGHHSMVDLFLAHGADVLATDWWGRTPLSEAKTEEVIMVMIGLTEDLNRQHQQTGNTVLHSCCLHGSEEAAKCLIEKGVRLDVKNNEGETALDIARAKGYVHIASHFPGHLQTGRFERDFEVVKDDQHKDGVLGKGAFGRVFKAKRRGTDDVFAIKEIPFPPEDAEKTLREVRAAMKLSREHLCILTHHDAWLEDRRTSDEAATSTQADGEDESARVLLSSSSNAGDSISRGGTSSQGGAVLRQKVVRFRTSTPVSSPDPAFSNEGQEQGPGEQHHESGNLSAGVASPSGTRADIDPRKGSSGGEESNECSSSPGEGRSDDIAVGDSKREEPQQVNRSQQTATIEEGESSQHPSPSAAEGRGDGVRLPQARDRRCQSQDESCGEERSESPSCSDEESDDGIVFENSGEETGQSNQSQQPETSGEEGSSKRPPSLAGESDDDVIFQAEPGQDSDQQHESSNEDESNENSSPSQEGSDDGIAFEETEETGRNDRSQNQSNESSSPCQEGSDDGIAFEETEETGRNDRSQNQSSESSSPSQKGSDDGIAFEETEETGRNDQSQNQSSESSSPSQEDSDDGIRFEETEETGRNSRSQDAISFNEGGSREDDQRSPPRGNEEESDEPPTRSSAQGGGSEGVWTSGAEGGSSTAAEEYLRKCTFTLYIQMDLMEMTLENYIRRRNEDYLEKKKKKKKKSSALSEEDRRTAKGILYDLCRARDPSFEETPYSVRLSDFGLSTRLVDEFGAGMYKTVGCGTVSYAAPEQLKGGPGSTSKGAKYGKGVDIYSLALIAVELWVPMSISERPRVFDGLRSPESPERTFFDEGHPPLPLLKVATSQSQTAAPSLPGAETKAEFTGVGSPIASRPLVFVFRLRGLRVPPHCSSRP
ncbi:unnamed protein product [Cyprideis torosa]|uniref:Uncharacterized protein n=1 Tax=Cyprideis torosa TaxID=163714 RepID=A0A7R8WQU0_9CRUS|nr:unnamed protein product [Cyprideis torosa]CAG0903405.1 unnamed protein product [Cyprideis torosa]